MKRINNILLLLIANSIIISCKIADVRPNRLKSTDTYSLNKEAQKKLKEVYLKMGLDKLLDKETYTLEYKEQYFGIGKTINKFKSNPAELTLDYVPGKFIGRATVNNGKKKGNQYFYNEGKTYYKPAKGKEKKKHKIAKKWIHYHQYFLEFPLRIQEATAFSYAGDSIIDNKEYDLVLASWNTTIPQKKLDQYLIAINKKTNRIDFIQFTVRDIAGFIANTAKYTNFIEQDGIYYPSRISIHGKKYNSNKLYEMSVQKLTFDKVKKSTITNFNN